MNHQDASVQVDAMAKWMGPLPAVADPTRLRLLRLLEGQELGVAELCEVLQMPQSTVSRHLKLLADQSWVVSRRNGTTNLYQMICDELDEPARQLWSLAREQTERWATFNQDRLRLLSRNPGSQSFFAGVAGEWPATREQLYGTGFRAQAFAALLPSHWTVADLGCGTGDITAELAQYVGRVIGVDNSPAMLEAARQNSVGLDNVELRQGAMEDMPIDNGSCDAALSLLVLTYVTDPRHVVREVWRILQSAGGKAVIVDLMRHDRAQFRRDMGQQSMGFDLEELENIMTHAGFTQVVCRPLRPEPEAKGPALLLATGIRKETRNEERGTGTRSEE